MKRMILALFILAAMFLMGCDPTNTPMQSGPSTTVTTTGGSSPSVVLNWTASANTQGYDIEQSSDGVNFTQISQVSSAQTTYTATGVSVGMTYYYRIRAYNSGGTSPYTSVVLATP